MPILLVEAVLALALALITQNVIEWMVHKYVLHDLGIKKDSFWHYHWKHHNKCRKHNNFDKDYDDFFKGNWGGARREFWIMVLLSVLVVVPVYFFVWPLFGACLFLTEWYYFLVHAWSHVYVEAGKKWLPWHYEHHMGRDQNKNWCVSFPWFDWVMRTRVRK